MTITWRNGPYIKKSIKEASYISSKAIREFKLLQMRRFTSISLILRPSCQRWRTSCLTSWVVIKWCLVLRSNMELLTNKIKSHLTFTGEGMSTISWFRLWNRTWKAPLVLSWRSTMLLLSHKLIKFTFSTLKHSKSWVKFQSICSQPKQEKRIRSSACKNQTVKTSWPSSVAKTWSWKSKRQINFSSSNVNKECSLNCTKESSSRIFRSWIRSACSFTLNELTRALSPILLSLWSKTVSSKLITMKIQLIRYMSLMFLSIDSLNFSPWMRSKTSWSLHRTMMVFIRTSKSK